MYAKLIKMASFHNLLFNIVDSDLLCSICSLDNTGLCYGGKYVLSFCFIFILLLPYSGKVWRGKSLANLVNCLWFAKLKSSNLVLTIDNLIVRIMVVWSCLAVMLLIVSETLPKTATINSHSRILLKLLLPKHQKTWGRPRPMWAPVTTVVEKHGKKR